MPKITRRDLLESGVTATLLAGLAPWGAAISGGRRAGRAGNGEARRYLAGLFSDMDAARAVGRSYGTTHPREADAARLWRQIFGADGPPPHPAMGRLHLARKRERDFAGGDIVVVDGWVLARSEARLCLLAALS